MPKKPTVRFYTAADRYVEWRYLSDMTYFDFVDWFRFRGYFLIRDKRIDYDSPKVEIFKLLGRTKNAK